VRPNSKPETISHEALAKTKVVKSRLGSKLQGAVNRIKNAGHVAQQVQKSSKRATDDLTIIFQSVANQKSPEMILYFWTELKGRLIHRFGNLEEAFRVADITKDGSLNLAEFSAMLKSLDIHLSRHFCRVLFEKASGKDKELSYEEFVQALMATTLNIMSKQMKQMETNSNQVDNYVNAFIRRLVFASEENKTTACDRFQGKFTKLLITRFWARCRKYTMRYGERSFDVSTFLSLMKSCRNFFPYEDQFLRVIYSDVDRKQTGNVNIMDMVTVLVLLSGWDKKDQLSFLFRILDYDDDNCLTSDQILAFYVSLLIHQPIMHQNKSVYEANIVFNDELALQEGRRLFHITMDSLDLADGVKSLVNFEEIWEVLSRHSFMLDALLPGVNNCRWVMKDLDAVKDSRGLLPPVNGITEASAFRRDVSRSFLTTLREEETEMTDNADENWADVHKQTFRTWAENALVPADKVERETSSLSRSRSEPAIRASPSSLAELMALSDPVMEEMQDHRFGKASLPRFIMYSSVKSSWLRHSKIKNVEIVPYRCRLCSNDSVFDYHEISMESTIW